MVKGLGNQVAARRAELLDSALAFFNVQGAAKFSYSVCSCVKLDPSCRLKVGKKNVPAGRQTEGCLPAACKRAV